jgi:hypothetical protein
LSRQGSLSCHTCCDTGPQFFRSNPKDRPIQSPLTTHKGMWRIYSNPDHHGSHLLWRFDNNATDATVDAEIFEPRQIEIDLMAILGHFEIFIISDGVWNAEFKTEKGIQIEIQRFENDMFLKSSIFDVMNFHSVSFNVARLFHSWSRLSCLFWCTSPCKKNCHSMPGFLIIYHIFSSDNIHMYIIHCQTMRCQVTPPPPIFMTVSGVKNRGKESFLSQ